VTDYLTTNQLAERLQVRPQTLRVWRLAGKGPRYVRLGSRRGRVLYPIAEVDTWLEDRTFGSTSEESVAVLGVLQ